MIIIAFFVLLIAHKHCDRIVSETNTRITPVVWLFATLLILSVPASIPTLIDKDPPAAKPISGKNASSRNHLPNIILISWDTLSAKNMQLYGYHRPTTPFLSEWSEDAIVFRRAYSSSNWTPPSSMSLMTGQRVLKHGLWYRSFNNPLKSYKNNLPSLLRENGYNIYGFVQNYLAHPDSHGIGEAFLQKDRASNFNVSYTKSETKNRIFSFIIHRQVLWELLTRDLFQLIKNLFLHESDAYTPGRTYDTNVPPDSVYNSFLTSLSKDKIQEPMFVWLHTYPPHAPYRPPQPFLGRFGDINRFPDLKKGLLEMGEYQPEDQARMDYLRDRYDEFIMYSDERFRIFMNTLSDIMDLTNTVIIFVADHGESFTDGYYGHAIDTLYEQVVHIPLIIKMPGIKTRKNIGTPVEITDIPSTILDIIGMSIPDWMDGRSLLPLITGVPIKPRPVFSTFLRKNSVFDDSISKGLIAAWEGEFKLIHNLESNESMLFNVLCDPEENQNLLQDNPEVAKRLLNLTIDEISAANRRKAQQQEY